jgi:hypothetical protein
MIVVLPDTATYDVVDRLKVWRDRWQHAQTPEARAHAQEAIDLWLDRYLESCGSLLDVPVQAQPNVIGLRTPVTV